MGQFQQTLHLCLQCHSKYPALTHATFQSCVYTICLRCAETDAATALLALQAEEARHAAEAAERQQAEQRFEELQRKAKEDAER